LPSNTTSAIYIMRYLKSKWEKATKKKRRKHTVLTSINALRDVDWVVAVGG